jgi:hypothetical protein
MALLLLSQHKMIDWLTESISKHKSLNKQVKEAKQQEDLGRENTYDYLRRMKEFINKIELRDYEIVICYRHGNE